MRVDLNFQVREENINSSRFELNFYAMNLYQESNPEVFLSKRNKCYLTYEI